MSAQEKPPWSSAETPLATLDEALVAFNRARDWEQFHAPKDLAMQLSVEAAEVLELFLWKERDGVPSRERLTDELGDVLITLSNLARRVGIDPLAAAQQKLAKNALRYPVALAHGRADKYDALHEPVGEADDAASD